jgi:hypothetical protein
MKLKDIAIWWSSKEELRNPSSGSPQFVVLEHMASGNSRFSYLSNSVGRCFMGWETADPEKLAAYVMFIFNQAVVRDGVDPEEAHRELMKIDEYKAWHEREDGPFRDSYYRWMDNMENVKCL